MTPKIIKSKLNNRSIQQKISRSRRFNQQLEKVANDKFKKVKQRLMKNFENHPGTQEISGGVSSPNISDSLGGYGNLFSFIGFQEGSSPIDEVKIFLENSIKLKIQRRNKSHRRTIEKKCSINVPSVKDFSSVARMPFEGGNSWIEMIERGMSNFSNYMNKKTKASRSGAGIQIEGRIRMDSSKPTMYMTELLDRFRKELRSK